MLDRDFFHLLVREALDGTFIDEHGFRFERVGYARELPGGLRQAVTFDLHRETGETFRVLLGLNSSLISDDLPSDEGGSCFIQYLTKSGISDFPRNWACHNEATAQRSLKKVGAVFDRSILPWLERYQSLADLAALLGEEYPEVTRKLGQAAEAAPRKRGRPSKAARPRTDAT